MWWTSFDVVRPCSESTDGQKFIYLLARFVGSKCSIRMGYRLSIHQNKGKQIVERRRERKRVRERTARRRDRMCVSMCVSECLCVESHRIRPCMKINRYCFATHDVSGNSIQRSSTSIDTFTHTHRHTALYGSTQ